MAACSGHTHMTPQNPHVAVNMWLLSLRALDAPPGSPHQNRRRFRTESEAISHRIGGDFAPNRRRLVPCGVREKKK
eukprot:3132052-Pyramimonas_sp.AAC.1